MELTLSKTVENALLRVARKTDNIFCQEALNILKASRNAQTPKRMTSRQKTNMESIRGQLPDGIYTRTRQVVDMVSQALQRTSVDSTMYSPLVFSLKEFNCCKKIKFNQGNIITGRNAEISKILLTLCRSHKRGTILVGEPGVGKTAIVREINNRLIQRTVPNDLKGANVLNMDIPWIFANYKQDPIGTIVGALERASDYDKAILFIDEVHQLIGHHMNNVMKPYLTEKIRFIGSTTIDEYHTIINEDRALERRFTVVYVEEPSVKKTIPMVQGTKSVFEDHHGCSIPDSVCEYAVINGSRFLGQRRNPDKSLDIIDIACSIMGEEERHTVIPEMERTGEVFEDLQTLQSEIKGIHVEPGNRILSNHYVNKAISTVTTIDFDVIKNSLEYEGVCDKMLNNIFGQDDAVKSIANVVNIFKHSSYERVRPVSVLLVVGPTGVGKKESCKLLARYLYGTDQYFIDYEMSGLKEGFRISELKGAPPGYVGYAKSGALIKAIKNRPQSVVYFRGIDKAHDEIQSFIIDACRNGKMVDSAEREAKLNNTIIIYAVTLSDEQYETVNKGSQKTMGFSKAPEVENVEENKKEAIKRIVGEELFNNADEVILYNKLNDDNLKKIYDANVENNIKLFTDVDIDLKELEQKVLSDAKNGHHIMSKLASVTPNLVFRTLKEKSL